MGTGKGLCLLVVHQAVVLISGSAASGDQEHLYCPGLDATPSLNWSICINFIHQCMSHPRTQHHHDPAKQPVREDQRRSRLLLHNTKNPQQHGPLRPKGVLTYWGMVSWQTRGRRGLFKDFDEEELNQSIAVIKLNSQGRFIEKLGVTL